MDAFMKFTKIIIKEWTFSLGTLIKMIILVEGSYEECYKNEINWEL